MDVYDSKIAKDDSSRYGNIPSFLFMLFSRTGWHRQDTTSSTKSARYMNLDKRKKSVSHIMLEVYTRVMKYT